MSAHVVWTFVAVALFSYFSYHLMHGDQGYFALKGVEERLQRIEAEYKKAHIDRVALEKRVVMLRPGSIDADLLDERVRAVLGYVGPKEKVVVADF
ncbi:MAG: septum formation initiator family protein [Alphaproteobacteria bacterium]|nr:septum formation initiator family protein [Alphaproteobacteria bacterium]